MNLCLGTVQFGIDYGLSGRQKPSCESAIAILDKAVSLGIDSVDTSALYGDAEQVVGAFLSQGAVSREKIFLVSKFGTSGFDGLSTPACADAVLNAAQESLSRLGTTYLDAYICHVPTAVYDDRIMRSLVALRESGLARHVGFTVYEVDEARTAIRSEVVDFLQIPMSILDQRMRVSGVLDEAQKAGVQLHSRSAFVQGLALRSVDAVPSHLSGIVPYLRRLDDLCLSLGMSRCELALAFVRSFPQISHLVFGVHDLRQLQQVVESFAPEVPAEAIREAWHTFSDIDPVLVMPNKWRTLK